jgi:hypothetical protein
MMARSAALSMARPWRWFTEGFDTLDLRKVKALLEQLRP